MKDMGNVTVVAGTVAGVREACGAHADSKAISKVIMKIFRNIFSPKLFV